MNKKKYFLLCCVLFNSLVSFSQQGDLGKKVLSLKNKIGSASKAEKLILMDSLITLVEFNEIYNYTSLIQENIKLALELDSVGLATKHTADFIYYNINIVGNPTKGLEIFEEFKGIEKTSTDLSAAANLYLYAADGHFFLRDLTSSLALLQTAKDYAIKSGNQNRLGSVFVRTGFIKTETGQFAAASQSLQSARKIFSEVKDTINILGVNNALAILYSQNKFYKEAKNLRDESIELSKKTSGKPHLFTLYYNTSADYREQGKNAERIKYLKLAKSVNDNSPQKSLYEPFILGDFVIAYSESDSLNLAEKYYLELSKNKAVLEDKRNSDYYLEASKQISLARKNYPEAIKYGIQHLELKKNQDAFVEIYNAENFLATAYKAAGKIEKANEHLVSYFKIKDSISTVNNVRVLSYYQTIFETEKRDLTIKAQQANIALLDEKTL